MEFSTADWVLRDWSPVEIAKSLSHLPGFVYLDSSLDGEGMERSVSVIAAEPTAGYTGSLFVEEDFAKLAAALAGGMAKTRSGGDLGLPGAGLYGAIEYDGRFRFGSYRRVLVYDHHRQSWSGDFSLIKQAIVPRSEPDRPSFGPVRYDLEEVQFCRGVERAKDYITSGDIYQVNLSHAARAVAEKPLTGRQRFQLYQAFREISPAPFAAYLDLGDEQLLSSSPELFLRMSGRTILTSPIKGTRPRFRDTDADERSAYELKTSSKEIAELIMITDLERNDLGQVCEFGSVEPVELLELQRFAQVFHLVSTVRGQLREHVSHLDALKACYPGGSITGAPKKRAREIISEIETTDRGYYTGAIGYLGFNGESQFNIAIRTASLKEGMQLSYHTGAGIVADSEPGKEWQETLHKAAGFERLVAGFSG